MEDKNFNRPKFPIVTHLLMIMVMPPTLFLFFLIFGFSFRYIPPITHCGLVNTITNNIHATYAWDEIGRGGHKFYFSNGIVLTPRLWSLETIVIMLICLISVCILFFFPVYFLAHFLGNLLGFNFLDSFEQYNKDYLRWQKSTNSNTKIDINTILSTTTWLIIFFLTGMEILLWKLWWGATAPIVEYLLVVLVIVLAIVVLIFYCYIKQS
jgi:hypothetical protein